MGREKILVTADKDDIFFHVFGDDRKYYDLDSIILHHGALSDYITEHRYKLLRQFNQKREILGLV